MLKNLFALLGLGIILVLSGCSNKMDSPHFMWNDMIYIATYEPIVEEEIIEVIGTISRVVEGTVKESGEGKGIAQGTRLYQIKGREISSGKIGYIAYEMDDTFYIASKYHQ
ncbi:hypothetical protein JCM9140_3044 [Halalkalibacter wakoensis JCM 9140]|uniref:Lipoprotein n=1 Tax=Halalkalibacter wakoensis JCM 9140 TaxID=1236970 RepID=W4Q4S6_9BACI|nr:hypothetical protein [Halalkalibacter wakoensis]GAE26935.1 hypothetical protein JCM9140_3044 [Halalkalibacter wakoensis JCM 9140]